MIRAAVIGWPVSQSRSPLIHGHWLEQFGIDGEYGRIAVEPERIDSFFSNFAGSGLAGCNVTIPYKEIAARAASHREPIVERIGAANTLWMENGELCADNTDGAGFAANLDERAPGWDKSGEALVLGAGGAAAAVVDALIGRGFTVHVVNRTLSRAEVLANRYPGQVSADVLSAANRYAATASFIVNTTSLGMKGDGSVDLDMSVVQSDAVITDIVYVPLATPFLKAAAARGLRTVDGSRHAVVPGGTRIYALVRMPADGDPRTPHAD